MKQVEYVPRKEVKEYKLEMMETLHQIRQKLKEEYDVYFEIGLVGSARRNLVLKKGNSNYDVDIQMFTKSQIDPDYRKVVFDEIRSVLDEKVWNVKNSTSVITVKKYKGDIEIKSFDIAILSLNKDENRQNSRFVKTSNTYTWNITKNSGDHNQKRKTFVGNDWSILRQQYKNLKSDNWDLDDENKKPSYALFIEAVNNTYDIINK